jgi:hypothetical protein
MKYCLVLLIILTGCGANITQTRSTTDKGKIDQSAFFAQQKDISTPSFTITSSGNGTVYVGDKALITKEKTSTSKSIESDSAWDLTFAEAYEKYQTLTLVFIGIGLCLVVFAIKKFEQTSVGKVFTGVNTILASKLKHLDPNSEGFKLLHQLNDEIEDKSRTFLKKG